MAGKLVHWEFPADDAGRAKSFWNSLFGWDFQEYEGSGYHMTQSTDPGGALQGRQEGQTGVTVYFDTDDVSAAADKVTSLGGTVLMPKSLVPGMGYFAICHDTEGNTFGLWESDTAAAPPS
jgi:predicted enzyme related to lactoylglutathione lyase